MSLLRGLFCLVILCCLTPMCHAASAPSALSIYVTALDSSHDPAAIAIKREAAAGPAALAAERAAAIAANIPLAQSAANSAASAKSANAAADYAKIDPMNQQEFSALPEYAQPLDGTYSYTPEQVAAVQHVVDKFQGIYTLLQQAAAMPTCVFPPNGAAVPVVRYPPMPQLIYTTGVDMALDGLDIENKSMLLALQGNYPAAVQSQALGYQIGEQLMESPSLVNVTKAMFLDEVTNNELKAIMTLAGPNAALDAEITKVVQADSASLTLKSSLIVQLDGNLSELQSADDALLKPGPLGPGITPHQARFVQNLMDANEARLLSLMIPVISDADQPDPNRRDAFDAYRMTHPAPASFLPDIDPITPLLNAIEFTDFDSLFIEEDRIHRQDQVIMAAATILAAKANTGSYPVDLPGPFCDPFNGNPLDYRLNGTAGFMVHSTDSDGIYVPGSNDIYQFPRRGALYRYPPKPPPPVPADMVN